MIVQLHFHHNHTLPARSVGKGRIEHLLKGGNGDFVIIHRLLLLSMRVAHRDGEQTYSD